MINTCSYNYLGFADNDFDMDKLMSCVDKYGLGCYINRSRADLDVFQELERHVVDFLGVEDAIVHTMGYDTNALSIPYLVDSNTLILSDQFNHNSIVKGCTVAGATIKRFRHDQIETLEEQLRAASRGGYSQVLVLVEGLYSMEGSYVDLQKVCDLKKHYNFLLFVDEAHSIGALGRSGKGIREYYDCYDVDFCMGTFTKSFSSVGGYIGGKKVLIEKLRALAPYYNSYVGMSPLFAQQTLNALNELRSEKGIERIHRLKENSIYFRQQLKQMDFTVYGNDDSPVVPVLFYDPTLMLQIMNRLIDQGVAAVVVGFPAVPLTAARIRFCISASHTRADLDVVLRSIS